MQGSTDNLNLIWELLYDEQFKKSPNPNLEENQVRIKVEKKERAESLRRLKNGVGKPLFEIWEQKIKRSIVALVADPQYRQCNCPAVQLIIQISNLIDLWVEAETVINNGGKNETL